MKVTARSVMPNHRHNSKGVHIQFDSKGMYSTDRQEEVEVLMKNNNRPGFWTVISVTGNKLYNEELKRKSRPAIVNMAIKAGFMIETGTHPNKVRTGELIDYLTQTR
jgi:hypothetical protein